MIIPTDDIMKAARDMANKLEGGIHDRVLVHGSIVSRSTETWKMSQEKAFKLGFVGVAIPITQIRYLDNHVYSYALFIKDEGESIKLVMKEWENYR